MKHTLKKLSDTQVVVSVAVDEATLTTAKTHALSHLGKSVKVQGFRKGKVPAAVIEKNVDQNALGTETVESAINLALNQIIADENLRVIDQPAIEIKKFVPFSTLEFDATIDVLPEITLGNYKKLKATPQKIAVTDKEVTEVIERMRQGFAEKTPVTRKTKDGDEVVINFEGKDEKGASIEGASGNEYALRLGSNTFIPGFEEQLVGHGAGETFDIKVTFPKDYHADHLKGAPVTFTVTIVSILDVSLPKVDDEFAKKSGPFDSIKALKSDIKRELQDQKDRQAVEKLKDDLLGELVEKSKVPLPQILVDDQAKSIEQDLMQNLMYRGQTIDQYVTQQGFKDVEEWRSKELSVAAERRVKAGLVIAELSKVENIEISKDELEAELARRKEEAPTMASQLESPDARRDLANRVITEKTINRLVELNT